jgi:hypothetical protein
MPAFSELAFMHHRKPADGVELPAGDRLKRGPFNQRQENPLSAQFTPIRQQSVEPVCASEADRFNGELLLASEAADRLLQRVTKKLQSVTRPAQTSGAAAPAPEHPLYGAPLFVGLSDKERAISEVLREIDDLLDRVELS